MYIKRGAWKNAASTAIQMNVLVLEWGVSNLIGHKSRKLNRMWRNRMESLQHNI